MAEIPMNNVPCPICGQEVRRRHTGDAPCFPFCSERCRLIDLGRWLGEGYRLPAESEDSVEEDGDTETGIP